METENQKTAIHFRSISQCLGDIITHSPMKYPTNMKVLDQALGGGFTAGLYVLGAIPNLGKSTFALQLANQFSTSGIPVLFFSLEMPEQRLLSKLISQELYIDEKRTNYTSDQIISSYGKEEQLTKEVDFIMEKKQDDWSKIYIIEQASSAKDIQDIVIEFCETHAKEIKSLEGKKEKNMVVIVDYLQLLNSPTPVQWAQSNKAILDENIRYLKKMSMNFPVLLISSLNRDQYDEPASLKGFKESGSIEYTADVALTMDFSAAKIQKKKMDMNVEKNKDPREIDLTILKQRYGRSGGDPIQYHYYAAYDYFEEVGSAVNSFDKMYQHLPLLRFY